MVRATTFVIVTKLLRRCILRNKEDKKLWEFRSSKSFLSGTDILGEATY